jgi:O-antigen/teichoic acid export membrane protein
VITGTLEPTVSGRTADLQTAGVGDQKSVASTLQATQIGLRAHEGGRSLRANFAWAFTGNAVYAACQWAMLVCLAKIGSPEMVGRFALGLAITAPIFMFANLQLRAVEATDARGEFAFPIYLYLRLATTALALISVAMFVIVAGYESVVVWAVVGIAVAKSFEAISDIFFGRLQKWERLDRIGRSQVAKGLMSLIAFVSAVAITDSVAVGAIALAAAWATILFAYDSRRFAGAPAEDEHDSRVMFGRNSWQALKTDLNQMLKLAWLALPLGIVILLISLNTNIPRYFLEGHEGERGLGIFAAMAYLMVAGSTIVSALGQTASPRLAKYFAAGNFHGYRTLVSKMVGLGLIGGLVAVIVAASIGKQVLTLMYSSEYATHASVLIWITIAEVLLTVSHFLGVAISAARRFRVQVPLFVLVTVMTVVSSALLIPRYGLEGAAYSILIAASVQTFGVLVIFLQILRSNSAVKEERT